MNYRSSEILAAEAITTAATKTIDINLKDVISRLSIELKLTGVLSVPTAHPAKAISKIEIVDGSNVIFSMKGIGALALDYYDTGVVPAVAPAYLAGVSSEAMFNLNFGRKLFDEELALDPKRFNNLQLKISHDVTKGGCAPVAGEIRVFADVFDQKVPTLRGFLCSKEHYAYTLASAGIEYVDLPTDFLIRKLLLQTYSDTTYPYQQINQVKLSEDHDKRVILEGYQSDFIKRFAMQYPIWKELLRGAATAVAANFYVTPSYWTYFAGLADDDAAAYLSANIAGGSLLTVKASGNCNFEALVQGYCPLGAVVYPFGKQDDLNDWWDVTQLGSARLKLSAGASGVVANSAEVITQQLRTY